MTRLVSIGTKIKQIVALTGTKDVNDWEDRFLQSVGQKTGDGEHTTALTDKQVDVIERIWERHFA